MNSHELARILLANPDLPVATYANNHTYASGADSDSHGSLKVALLHHYAGQHIAIGNMYQKAINPPNWYVIKDIHGKTSGKGTR